MEDEVEIAKKLVSFDTQNPPSNTVLLLKYVCSILKRNRISYRLMSKKRNMVYLISEIGRGSKRLVLYGHIDVVPVGDLSRWKTKPFSPMAKGGMLYGRGAADMKGACAGMISAFVELAQDRRLKGRLQLLLCPDEENYDIKDKLLLKIIKKYKADACLMGEPHLDHVIIGEKGELWVMLAARGIGAHGSTPAAGVDAGLILDSAIHEIRNEIDRFNKSITQNSQYLKKLFYDSDSCMAEEFELKNDRFRKFVEARPTSRITMNVGYLKSGHNINIVPDAAEAHISFMVPYGFDYRKILHLVNKIVKRYTKSGNGSIKITYSDGTDPALTDPDAGIVSSVARAYTSVKKKKPRLVFDTGVSDAVFYRKAGVDTASYGPGAFSQAHQYNERVSIKEIRIAKRIYKQAAIDFLGVE